MSFIGVDAEKEKIQEELNNVDFKEIDQVTAFIKKVVKILKELSSS